MQDPTVADILAWASPVYPMPPQPTRLIERLVPLLLDRRC